MKHKDGEPCSHPGCMSHVSHPCEGCGRIWGKMDKYEELVKEFAIDEGWAIDRYSLAKLVAFGHWLDKKREKETCEWKDDGEGNWETSCGGLWVLIEGTPSENKMEFCPYEGCGRRIVEKT